MGRKGIISCSLLTAAALTTGCLPMPVPAAEDTALTIIFDAGELQSRSMDPNEDLISDISLLIFDADGNAEECIWLPDAESETTVSLIHGATYSICACANFGYQVYADHIDELKEITYYMAYPDEYVEGMPMFVCNQGFVAGTSGKLTLKLERLMAKISLKIDRSRLSEDVTMNVRAARIGNCPKSVRIWAPSRVTDHDQCFASGFSRNEFETSLLNIAESGMISGTVDLYMLENMQGEMSPVISEDQEKVFPPGDVRNDICSYVELELEYMSMSKYSSTKNLVYRFYLGEGLNNLDVERNCHYSITVRPEDDGLSGDGWRVDKSGITDRGPAWLKAYPQSYIIGNIGDRIHIWCEFSPPQAPFDVGIEYMEDDRAEGIYDYEIDADGHGATLTLTGPGTGLIYMEAGEPVNDAALFIIEVNLPEDNGQYETEHSPSGLPACLQRPDCRHRHPPQVQDR